MKEQKNKGIPGSAFFPLMLAVMLAIGVWLGSYMNPSTAKTENQEQLNKINSVLDYVEKNYVDKINRDKLVEDAIEKMLAQLDPHSSYIPARDLEGVEEHLEGRFQGIGIRFLILRDTLMVTNVIPGGPADNAGVKAYDRIIEIDGENVTNIGLTNEDVQDKLKGPAGSHVDVMAFNRKDKKDIRIIRNYVPVSSVTSYMIDEKTGYIQLRAFTENAYYEFISAAEQLLMKGMEELIFDLRNNSGGYLGQAANIVDEFLPSGKLIVYTEGNNRKRNNTYTTSNGSLKDIGVVVLINSYSASASEIVAGALQDNDRAIVMGRRSFGKGLVQEQEKLKDNSAIRLTIARYYTPTGRSIQKPYGEGIAYDEDILNRYENEEYLHIDSSLFVDSLKYTTEGGRVVYGGGGIMPDVFIPIDTSGGSFLLDQLHRLQAFYKFGFDYASRKGKSHFGDLKRYTSSFRISPRLRNTFFDYANGLGKVTTSEKDLSVSKSRIDQNIKAEIARFVWDQQGFTAVVNQYDRDVQQALKVLNLKKEERLSYRFIP